MNRRAFLVTLGGGFLAAPLAAEAQSAPKVWQIGWLYEGQAANIVEAINFFREEFKKLGYVERRDYLIHSRSADGHIERLAELAEELTGFPVDVLITSSTPTALAATQATRVIPIVMLGVADPVGSGLVRSFDRPGGNATGPALALDEVSRKWLEFLKAVRANHLSRVAVLHNSTNPGVRAMVGPLQEAARILAVTLTFHDFTPATAEASVFRAMAKDRPHGIVVLPDAFIYDERKNVFEQIARMRLPAIYAFRGYVVAGGLMSYGPDPQHVVGKAASYVDKILKGARPADLPIELPTKFNLVINLKTAKALGLTIPPSLLQRADQVIE
jgi:ABC-type uncharacterized transport system substrate-binding protein